MAMPRIRGRCLGLIEGSYSQMGKEYMAAEPVAKLRTEYAWLFNLQVESSEET